MQETFRWSALSEPDENVHLLYGYEMSHSYSVSAVSSCQQPSSALKVTNITLTWTFSWLKDHDLCIYKYSTVFDSSAVWFYFRLFSLWSASSGLQWMQTFLKRRTRGFNTKRLRGEREHEREMKRKRGGETSLPILVLLLSPKNQPLILASDSAK